MNSGELFIIPAGGNQTRWLDATHSKQLCVVDGETLLDRLYRQFGQGRSTALLAKAQDILQSWKVPEAVCVCDGPCLDHSLMGLLKGLPERNVLIVHGDVWLTEEAASFISTETRSRESDPGPLFFGTDVEIFACYWEARFMEVVMRGLGSAILDHKAGRGRGQLWALYRAVRKLNLHNHDFERIRSDPLFFAIKDGSTDFDTLRQYTDFMQRRGGE